MQRQKKRIQNREAKPDLMNVPEIEDVYPSEHFILDNEKYPCLIASDWLYDAMLELPKTQRETLILEFWYGYGDQEIAAYFHVTPRTIYNWRQKHLQQSANIMKGMAMKENDLTYELICAAVNGEKTALEEILRFYDDYINALATVKGEDAQGKTYRYIDEDLKARIQLKLIKAIPKWRGTEK
ncbi:helix-turn-helix domain-containing protein [Ruminococcus sp.]|uniref:helix-turn-helix domain-containing protein n=3 Tax=Bacillota TaxID=1239 RepID=UPI003991346A